MADSVSSERNGTDEAEFLRVVGELRRRLRKIDEDYNRTPSVVGVSPDRYEIQVYYHGYRRTIGEKYIRYCMNGPRWTNTLTPVDS